MSPSKGSDRVLRPVGGFGLAGRVCQRGACGAGGSQFAAAGGGVAGAAGGGGGGGSGI